MHSNRNPLQPPATALALALALAAANLASAVAGPGPGGPPAAPESRRDGADRHEKADKFLYVWAGDEARVHPDFLTVVDFNEHSANYGRILATANAPTAGNEPHHCHIASDGKVILCGGLLSLLRGQDGIFFFDISNPTKPRFLSSTRAPLSSITDDPYPLSNGGYLVTQMGSAGGDAPGRVAEFDANLRLIHEWPDTPPADGGFNPHGISVRPEANLMITSDFINPVTTLNQFLGPIEIRNTVRVWDLARRTIVRTIPIPGAVGTMDCKLIPGDPARGAYTCGMFDPGGSHLYHVDVRDGTVTEAFDSAVLMPDAFTQIFDITEDGNRIVVALSRFPEIGPPDGMVALLDISDRTHATVLSFVDLGPGSAPHDLMLTHDQKRVVVTDYFLNQDDFGKVHFDGDHKVHVLKLDDDELVLDSRFQLDFNTAFPGLRARPHGIDAK